MYCVDCKVKLMEKKKPNKIKRSVKRILRSYRRTIEV